MSSFTNNTNNLLNAYFSIQGSTTQFLNESAQAPVKVCILKQQLSCQHLYRESLLYIHDVAAPVLYARCHFYRDKLCCSQLNALLNSQIPVGIVLGVKHLVKKDQQFIRSNDNKLKAKLSVGDECWERSFALYRGDAKVANLTETVSRHSLARLAAQDLTTGTLVVGQ